jgi:hypothetical protein
MNRSDRVVNFIVPENERRLDDHGDSGDDQHDVKQVQLAYRLLDENPRGDHGEDRGSGFKKGSFVALNKVRVCY